MTFNWMSLILVLLDFAKDVGTIAAGYQIGTGHPDRGAIIAAAVVSVGKLAVVFGQNQPKPLPSPVPGAGGKQDSPGGQ
jgi:hypothetical protein